MVGHVPKYVSPRESAENRASSRAQLLRWLFWIAVLLPVAFAFMAYGYSDQAPAALRDATVGLDKALGSPVWTILKMIASRGA